MANRVFPGGPLGLFDVSLPATHWDATGTQIEEVENVPPIHPERMVRLNAVAVGDALYHAHEADPTGLWSWVLVVANGEQHVYHATTKEAANGANLIGSRIKGIKCVHQWMGEVGRAHRVRRERSTSRHKQPEPEAVRRVSPIEDALFDNYASSVAVFYCTPEDGLVTTSEVIDDLAALHGKQERLARKIPRLPYRE